MKRFSVNLFRRILPVVLCLVLCVGMLSGCGGGSSTFKMPEASEEAEIFVEPVPDISDDFIRGMDASAVLANEKSGVKYYNYEGEEQDVFMTLAQSGVNYIRLRVWNDPYDSEGHGYGGGNNDVDTAIELGKRATKYGMKVCIDFHYSDFWADPNKQFAPKAWEGMGLSEKKEALYEFTKDSLGKILDAGVDVEMVQIGNEINSGMSGETEIPAVMELLSSGSKAVREISGKYKKDIQVAVHYTNINEEGTIDGVAKILEESGVDYDVMALSYYSFWHGTFENLKEVIKNVTQNYGKKVVIAETSYCYTSEDGDDFGNSIYGIGDIAEGYPATVQSQASMVRDVCAAANEAGALGVFYWEGTWIPVGSDKSLNSPKWEEFGSGWASSYSKDYDKDDAGQYYGGCSWDNQAMFDFTGHPLASLNVFKYLKYGATAPLKVEYVPELSLSCDIGSELRLPETVDIKFNNPAENKPVPVKWDEGQISAIDIGREGAYDITGTLEDEEGTAVSCHVEVKLLNYVVNPSFEDEDTSMWNISFEGNNPTDFQKKADDAYTGEVALHFWSGDSDMNFSVEQEITDLEPGTYRLTAYSQGGDMSEDSVLELYAISGGKEQTQGFMVKGWVVWQEPTIPEIKVEDGKMTIGVRVKANVKSWGTVDEFTLNRVSD